MRRRSSSHREDAEAPSCLERLAAIRVVWVVETDLLEQRHVDRMSGWMEELGADIDGDALPLVANRVRVTVTADLGPRLEHFNVVRAGEKVRRSHASGTGTDDRDAAPRRSLAAAFTSARPCRVAARRRRPTTERRERDCALNDIPTRERAR